MVQATNPSGSRSRRRTTATRPRLDDARHERIDVRLRRRALAGTFPKELMVSGPAGTGKTLPILTLIHLLCKQYRLRCLIFRATRASLTESALVTFEEEILARDGMSWMASGAQRKTRTSYRYPNGSSIVLGGLDRNADKILSTAWDIAFCNEAIECKREAWETIGSRMSRPGRDRRWGWLIGDCNPGRPDHYLLQRQAAGNLEHWETTHKANPAMWTGDRWTDAGEDYLDRLGNLTGVRRKRFLQGLWVAGEGTWFDTFDPDIHIRPVEFDPGLPLHCSVDSGVYTGAVVFQVTADNREVRVLGDYLSEGRLASVAAIEINDLCGDVAPGYRSRLASTDSAGDSRTAVGGPVVTAEFVRAGLCHGRGEILRWPKFPGCVADGLNLIEEFVGGTDTMPPRLFVHPRCKALSAALVNYQRATRAGQWMDYPEDPQHPHEDLIDALRGGLRVAFPAGREEPKRYHAKANFRAIF